jgi:IMP dehydrogenase
VPLLTEGKSFVNILKPSLTFPSSVTKFVPYLAAGLKHSLQDMGSRSLAELHESVAAGTTRFELRSASAQVEGGIHMESYEKKLYA